MLTVADVLALALLEGARVVAGSAGLTREVNWVHSVAVPDAPDWLNGGELALTTVINMPQQQNDQRRYVRAMAEKGVAGLCITVGRYIDEIPRHLREEAEELSFPLIEIPFQARFIDIAKAINGRIAAENMQRVQRALSINQSLTQIVLEGGGFQQLAHKLAELVGHSISIETERFEAIATYNIAEVDEARHYTQLHGRTDPRLVEALEKRGYLPRIRSSLRPLHLPPMPDVGLEMERILAPVVVHGELYGFMWIIADDHALSEIDMMAIESGATIAALMMLYQESIQSAEASLKGSLLSQLIQGADTARETILTDQSLRYGLDLRSPYVMMLIELSGGGTQYLAGIYRAVNKLIATEGWHAVVGQFAGQVLILAQDNEQIMQLARHIRERNGTGRGGPQMRIGVSSSHQGAARVRTAHQQCIDVLYITRRLNPEQAIVRFDDLGYLHALYLAGSSSLQGNAFVPILQRLVDEKQLELFTTLEAYLDAGGNGVGTAETLHIHRSTLNYRLTRITSICEVDLQDPLVRMNLHVALKLMRLFEEL